MADEVKVTVVTGMDVAGIELVASQLEYKKGSEMVKKMKNTHYNIYVYDGLAFTSHSSKFIEAQESGDLHEVRLTLAPGAGKDGADAYELTRVITNQEFMKFQKKEFNVSLMKVENFINNPQLLTSLSDIEKVLDEA